MSSSQTDYRFMKHAGGRREPHIRTSISSTGSDHIDRFIMDQRRYASSENTTHNLAPQLSSVGNTHYVDFSYPYANLINNPALEDSVDAKMEHQSDLYSVSGRGSMSERRDSAVSPPRHASFSSNGPLVPVQDGSVEGSEEESPESNHERGTSIGDGYNDELRNSRSAGREGNDPNSRQKDGKDGLTPPWMELKTKAGKERKRLPLACIACRRKKIRCSGEKPACKHCMKSRIPCVYKVTTRKAAPRTDYMAMLDKRLKRMEDRIIRIVPKEEHDASAVTRAQVKPAIPSASPVAGKKRLAEEAFGAEIDAWAATQPKVNTSEEAGVASIHMQEVEESRLLSEGADALPSREIQEHLAEVFFDNLYGQSYHLLHKPSFMRKLKLGTVPPVLMLSVCAVSARFSTHPKLSSSPAFLRGESWAAEAREIVMKRYDWPNITILTCLLLLALHEFGTCYGGRSWALGGMAIRMAYTLQLHKDLDHDPFIRKGKSELSFIDREIRRRTMWACFLMDRFTSSGTNRPMFMKEETIKAQLPIKEQYFQLDIEGPTEDLHGKVPRPVSSDTGQLPNAKENMGVAAYMLRSIALWGRIVMYLFQSGRELESRPLWDPDAKLAGLAKEADEFITILPESLKYTRENLSTHDTEGLASQFSFLHISIQQNILFLNHIAAHGTPSGKIQNEAPRDFIANASAKAVEAAKRISELLKDAELHPVNTPFAGYCAFWSSSIQMTAVFSKNPTIEAAAKKNLATNVRYLSRMKRYWGAFHWTSEHLKEQFKACADAAQHGTGAKDSNQDGAPIYQYGDWFDRYPHGVSESDFEDPATGTKEKGDDAVLEQKSDYNTVEEFFNTLSPAPTQAVEREAPKPSKRKGSKRNTSIPQPQLDSSQALVSSSLDPGPPIQIRDPNRHQMALEYDQMNPNANGNVFPLPPYYSHDNIFPGHPNATIQFDRQLAFGSYAGLPDSLSFSGQNLMDNAGWDISMSNMGGFVDDPSTAWYVPFNLGQGGAGQSGDVFNSLGGTGVDYGMDNMAANNLGHVNPNMGGGHHGQ